MNKRWLPVMLALFLMLLPGITVSAEESQPKDIVDTAAAAGEFKVLAAALDKAGLVDTLKGKGPFTVFAPTDEAFAALLKQLNITAEDIARKERLEGNFALPRSLR
ncbi:fasciclin domain-containing protein [Paenibacillus sp. TRM 82003]|nr:fasciclin domain-containing protein [Paenibacillus sp. TRM 82003]